MADIRKQVVVNVRTDGEGVAEKLAIEFQAAQQKMAALQNAIATGNATVSESTSQWRALQRELAFLERELKAVQDQMARTTANDALQAKMSAYFREQRKELEETAQASEKAADKTTVAWQKAYDRSGEESRKAAAKAEAENAKAEKQAEDAANKYIEEARRAAEKQEEIEQKAAQKRADAASKLQSQMSDYFRRQNRDVEDSSRTSEKAADKTTVAWQRAYEKQADEARKAAAKTAAEDEREAQRKQAAADNLQRQMDAYFARQRKDADDAATANRRAAHETSEAWRQAYDEAAQKKVGPSPEEMEAAAQRFRGLNATIRNLGYGISDIFSNNGPLGQKIQGFANNVGFIVSGILQSLNKITPTTLAIAAGLEIAFTAIGAAFTAYNIKSLEDLGRLFTGTEKIAQDKLKAIEERIKELNEKPVLIAAELRELDEAQRKADNLKATLQEIKRLQTSQTEEQQESGRSVRESIEQAKNAKGEKIGAPGVQAALESQLLSEANQQDFGTSDRTVIDKRIEEIQEKLEAARERASRADAAGMEAAAALHRNEAAALSGEIEKIQTKIALNEKEASERAAQLTLSAVEGNESETSKGGLRQSVAQAELTRRLRMARLGQVAAEVETSSPEHIDAANKIEEKSKKFEEQEKKDFESKRKLIEDGQKHHRILEDMLAAEGKAAGKELLKSGREWGQEVEHQASLLGSKIDKALMDQAVGMKADSKDNDAIRNTLASSVYKQLGRAGIGKDIADDKTRDQFLHDITETIMKKFMTEFSGKISAKALEQQAEPDEAPASLPVPRKPKRMTRKQRLAWEAAQARAAEAQQPESPDVRAARALRQEEIEKENRRDDGKQARMGRQAKAAEKEMNARQIAAAMQQNFGLSDEAAMASVPHVQAAMKQAMPFPAAAQAAIAQLQQYIQGQEHAMLHQQAMWEQMMGVLGPATAALARQQAFNAQMSRQMGQLARGAQAPMLPMFPPYQ